MKIAIASDKGNVTKHFGYCESFMIFEAKGKEILKSEEVKNPGHKPGFLPNFLNGMGVNVIITGGMGGGAVTIFNDKNIEVIVGAKGDTEEVVKSYLAGELESTGSVCNNHNHED